VRVSKKRAGHPLCVKLTDVEKAIVDRLARRDGIIHLDGKPNRSAWVRRMIHQADEEGRSGDEAP
jgi:hypothetical protein